MEYHELIKLGFNKNEAIVYLSLIKFKKADALQIIKDTKFHKNIVYDNLEKLIDKGLVTFVMENSKKSFQLAPSNMLIQFFEEQEEEIKKVFVGKNILVQDKTFSIVDAGIQQGRIFFRVSCEGMQDIIDAEATEDNYLELYNRMIQSQREQKPESQQQVTDQSQTRPVESVLKEIEPELKFVYERKYKQKAIGIGFVMIGKVLNERPNKFGITLDEARKAWNSLENLKKDIKINAL